MPRIKTGKRKLKNMPIDVKRKGTCLLHIKEDLNVCCKLCKKTAY